MDISTGQVLVEKEMNQKMYPASITKIMTVLLALENADPATVHTMSYEATHSIDSGSTHIALTEGEQITLVGSDLCHDGCFGQRCGEWDR